MVPIEFLRSEIEKKIGEIVLLLESDFSLA